MYLSLNWLKDFVNLPKSLGPKELGLELTLHTVEVEDIIAEADKYNNVVVGKVLEAKQHPNADRLKTTIVDVGKEKLPIVCGAPNVEAGQLVPVALVGAFLGELEIKETEIRGEISRGMICAEDELGLGDNHEGIMVLTKAKVGQKFSDYLKLEDTIIEVDNKSLSNRPDLWGHYGIAREISAFAGLKLKDYAEFIDPKALVVKEDKGLKIRVIAEELCPRYSGVRIGNIKIEESPQWLKQRLATVGIRSINNIVDITNYVMLELGQPLHAFDASKVNEIIIRQANKKEKITTLDGIERELDSSMLVISDTKQAIAIAGVMGGENSEIDNNTTEIILESANFEAVSVRKTSQALGLRSEASMRFEKALDANLAELAIQRAITLIKKVLPQAELNSEIIDIKTPAPEATVIDLDLNWLDKLMGKELSKQAVMDILQPLGFEMVEQDRNLQVTVPSWRDTKDISIREDLLEEVARMYGYDKIIPKMPKVSMIVPDQNELRLLERRVRELLAYEAGYSESQNYSFVGLEQLKKMNIDFSGHIELANPITNQHTLLRQSLIPNLLQNVKTNQAKYNPIRLFEVGSVYLNTPGEEEKGNKKGAVLPYQEKKISLVLGQDKGEGLRELKGVVENLFSRLLPGHELLFEMQSTGPVWATNGQMARVMLSGHDLGFIATVSKEASNNLGLKKGVVVAELSLKSIFNTLVASPQLKYQAPAKFPAIERDMAFVVDAKVLYNDLRKEIINFHDLIVAVELFDVYEGNNLGDDKKSLAFHIIYQDPERTLVSSEIDEVQKQLSIRLQEKFEAQIRDF